MLFACDHVLIRPYVAGDEDEDSLSTDGEAHPAPSTDAAAATGTTGSARDTQQPPFMLSPDQQDKATQCVKDMFSKNEHFRQAKHR